MVYWLVLKMLPLRLIFGMAALVLGVQLMGVDLITPAVDWLLSHVDLSLSSLW